MKEITLQIPEGKKAEWINGVLTLVDEPKVDNRPVTERIKTFEDACNELEFRAKNDDETAGRLLEDYAINADNLSCKETVAYMRLCIITYALNEGWEPQFTTDEYRYYPWFYLYTKAEYDELFEEEKQRCVLRSGNNSSLFYGFVNVYANYDASYSFGYSGSRLVFKTRELAEYAGQQFTEEWADFMFKAKE